MRYRKDFVTNSSSSSFLIEKKYLDDDQIQAIKEYEYMGEKLGIPYSHDPFSCWDISENETKIAGYTSMDNFSFAEFFEKIGVNPMVILWNDVEFDLDDPIEEIDIKSKEVDGWRDLLRQKGKMMKKILLVVDLQSEFYENSGNFERILEFVNKAKENGYDAVFATRCYNSVESPFYVYHNWYDCLDGVQPLPFEPDVMLEKQTYGLSDYSVLDKANHYDVIGYNTDACVLKISMDLFDLGYDFTVLTDYCFSSSGEKQHKSGVELLRHLMTDAVK